VLNILRHLEDYFIVFDDFVDVLRTEMAVHFHHFLHGSMKFETQKRSTDDEDNIEKHLQRENNDVVLGETLQVVVKRVMQLQLCAIYHLYEGREEVILHQVIVV
jgi:hypothetical protein